LTALLTSSLLATLTTLATLLTALLTALLLTLTAAGFLATTLITLTARSLLTTLLTALIFFMIVCHDLFLLCLVLSKLTSRFEKPTPISLLLHSFKTDCSTLIGMEEFGQTQCH
jgi:hypothetical protein